MISLVVLAQEDRGVVDRRTAKTERLVFFNHSQSALEMHAALQRIGRTMVRPLVILPKP
jgi:hypothetical protein